MTRTELVKMWKSKY